MTICDLIPSKFCFSVGSVCFDVFLPVLLCRYYRIFNSYLVYALMDKFPDTLTPIQNLLCGFAGVAIPRTALAPIDMIKLIAGNNEGRVWPELSRRLSSEGILAMWHGVQCDWIRLPPQFILRYLVANQLRSLRMPPLLADNAAAVASIAAIHPIDVVHSLMQSNSLKYPSVAETLASVVRNDGITGLYRGLTPTVLGYIPYRAVQYCSVIFIDKLARRRNATFTSSFFTDAVGSSVVSTMAQFASYPFEVVRKRMMTDPTVKGKGWMEIMNDTYQRRGFWGLYDSFGWSIARTLPLIWTQQVATREFRKFVAMFNYTVERHKL